MDVLAGLGGDSLATIVDGFADEDNLAMTSNDMTISSLHGTYGDSLEMLEHLHQVTSTSLKLQVYTIHH